MRSERPDLKSERPERPDLRPERPNMGGRTYEQSDKQTNERTNNSVLRDFVLFGAAAQKANVKIAVEWLDGEGMGKGEAMPSG